MDIISLAEEATKEFVKEFATEGKLWPLHIALFVRIHELSGHPITCKYMTKKEDSGGYPLRLVTTWFGPMPKLKQIAEHYGLNPKQFHDELRRDTLGYIYRDSTQDEDTVVFRLRDDSIYSAENMDRLLSLYSVSKKMKALEQLLKKSNRYIT